MRIKNIKGFTLIELLVVISIIGLLASVLFVSFTTAQKQTRDSKRKQDLKQYQTALEVYATKNNGLYPSNPTRVAAATTLCTELALSNCGDDPRTPGSYWYVTIGGGAVGTGTATQFVMYATLEGQTNTLWVSCSNGKVGTRPSSPIPNGTCPL